MVITPKNFRISVARIMSSMTGAIQRIMTTNSFLRWNGPEDSTSSITVCGPAMCPIRMQVRNATKHAI